MACQGFCFVVRQPLPQPLTRAHHLRTLAVEDHEACGACSLRAATVKLHVHCRARLEAGAGGELLGRRKRAFCNARSFLQFLILLPVCLLLQSQLRGGHPLGGCQEPGTVHMQVY